MTTPADIADDFRQTPEVENVEQDDEFIKVTIRGGVGLSPLNSIEDGYKNEIKTASDHPDYDLSGKNMTVVYEFVG